MKVNLIAGVCEIAVDRRDAIRIEYPFGIALTRENVKMVYIAVRIPEADRAQPAVTGLNLSAAFAEAFQAA